MKQLWKFQRFIQIILVASFCTWKTCQITKASGNELTIPHSGTTHQTANTLWHPGILQKLWRKKFCKLWLSLSLTCPRWAPCVTHLLQTSSHIYEFFLYSTAGIWPSLSPNISFSAAPCPKWSSMLSQNNHQRILNCFSRGENGFASKQMQSLT